MTNELSRRTMLSGSFGTAALMLTGGTTLATAAPASASTSTDTQRHRYTHLSARQVGQIDNVISNINPLNFGIEVAVFTRDTCIFDKGYGLRDRGRPDTFSGYDFFKVEQLDQVLNLPRGSYRPNAKTIFNIGSVSKEFTAGVILLLHERGELSLTDPITRYFPHYHRASHVTVANLLHHESGIPDYNEFPDFQEAYDKFVASGQTDYSGIVDKLKTLDLAFAPGSSYAYSNTNFLLLGLIAERVSGIPFAQLLQDKIFGPLGMDDTRQGYPRPGQTNVALGYFSPDGSTVNRAYQWNLPWLQGPGGITSTVVDLGKWDWAIQRPGLFRRSTLEIMFTPLLARYACGWVIDNYRDQRFIWHNGEVGGFHTMNALFVERQMSVVLLSNNETLQPQLEYAAPRIFDAVEGLTR